MVETWQQPTTGLISLNWEWASLHVTGWGFHVTSEPILSNIALCLSNGLLATTHRPIPTVAVLVDAKSRQTLDVQDNTENTVPSG
jgi:hypothetical protein